MSNHGQEWSEFEQKLEKIMPLSKLQKKFKDTLFYDPDIAKAYTEDEEIAALEAEIKTMDAIELRRNIKIFHETNRSLGYEF